jgi:hypothetical protein
MGFVSELDLKSWRGGEVSSGLGVLLLTLWEAVMPK